MYEIKIPTAKCCIYRLSANVELLDLVISHISKYITQEL